MNGPRGSLFTGAGYEAFVSEVREAMALHLERGEISGMLDEVNVAIVAHKMRKDDEGVG